MNNEIGKGKSRFDIILEEDWEEQIKRIKETFLYFNDEWNRDSSI